MRTRLVGTVVVGLIGWWGVGCSADSSVEATAPAGSEVTAPDSSDTGSTAPDTTDAPPTTCVRAPVTTFPGVPSDEVGECLPPGYEPTIGSSDAGGGDGRAIITGVGPRREAMWKASGAMSDEARTMLIETSQRYETALLVPPAGRWPDPAVIEVRFDSYVPDPGYVVAGTVAREAPFGDLILSVQGQPERGDPCAVDRGQPYNPATVRGVAGCTAFNGIIAFVTWSEGGLQWHAETDALGVDELSAELAAWQLVTADHL